MENGFIQKGHVAEGGRWGWRRGEEILRVVMQIVQSGTCASFVTARIVDVHITLQGSVQADWA